MNVIPSSPPILFKLLIRNLSGSALSRKSAVSNPTKPKEVVACKDSKRSDTAANHFGALTL